MMSRFASFGRRALLTGAAVLAGAWALAPNTAGAAGFTACTDFAGVPRPLDSTPTPVGAPGNTYTNIVYDAGTFFQEGGPGDGSITDLNVFVKIKHPRVEQVSIWLRHTFFTPDGEPDILTIELIDFGRGCLDSDWDPNQIYNQDISILFDSETVAAAAFACDLSIPTLSGRYRPTTSQITDIFKPDSETAETLADYNGRPIGNSIFELVIFDAGNTGETAALVETCLVFNNQFEGDTAPREETATISQAQSGQGIVTIADHIGSALTLLDYLVIDDRLYERRPTNLAEFAGDPTPLVFDELFLNEDLYENYRRSSANEFNRLDSSPRSTGVLGVSGGDGRLTVADWVQTTRYAAGVGFDEPAPAAGPFAISDRIVRIGNTVIPRGVEVEVPVIMRSRGSESEIAFGLQFDQQLLEFTRAVRGDCVPENAIFQLNNLEGINDPDDPTSSVLGLQIGLLPDQTFLCDYTPLAPLLGTGDPADPERLQNDVVLDSDNTRPAAVSYDLSTKIKEINFDDPNQPFVLVDFIIDNPLPTTPIRDVTFDIIFDHTRLTPFNIPTYELGPSSNLTTFRSVYVVDGNNDGIEGSGQIRFDGLGLPRITFHSTEPGLPPTRLNAPSSPTTPSIGLVTFDQDFAGLPDTTETRMSITVNVPDSTLLTGAEVTVLTLRFDILLDRLVIQETKTPWTQLPPSTTEPVIELARTPESIVTNGNAFGKLPFSRTGFNFDATDPIRTQAQLSLVDSFSRDPEPAIPGTNIADGAEQYIDLLISNNIAPITETSLRLSFDNQLRFVDVGRVIDNAELNPGDDPIADEIFATLGLGNIEPASPLFISTTTPFTFLNGPLIRLQLRNTSGAAIDLETSRVRAAAIGDGNPFVLSGARGLAFSASSFNFAGTKAGDEAPKLEVAEPVPSEGSDNEALGVPPNLDPTTDVSTRIIDIDATGLVPRLTIGVYVSGNIDPVTNYNFLLSFDGVELVLADVVDTVGGYGTTVTAEPEFQRANFDTYRITGSNAGATFTNDQLLTLKFDVVGRPTIPPSIFLNATPPISEETQIASVFFRAREDPAGGGRTSQFNFVLDPLFFQVPTVRNPAGTPIYASFANAGVTVIDNADSRPTVRVANKVLCPDKVQTVQVVLDSVGVENAIGFKLNFPSDEVILLGVAPGSDIPPGGFFYTLPNENALFDVTDDPNAATDGIARTISPNTDRADVITNPFFLQNQAFFENNGEISILTSLQPGESFEESQSPLDTRVVVNLYVIAGNTPSNETELTFNELFENLDLLEEEGLSEGDLIRSATRGEVVSPEGLRVVADFPTGRITVPAPGCTYSLADFIPADGVFTPEGGEGSLTVITQDTCPWSATSTQGWLRITEGSGGFATGPVGYAVSANNSTADRTAFLEIACDSYQVVQEGCEFEFTPDVLNFSQFGAEREFELTTSSVCSWQLSASNTWINFVSNNVGVGSATIRISVDENTAGEPRSGTIRLIAADGVVGATLTINQGQCTYALEPVQAEGEAERFPASGGTGSVTIQTDSVDESFCSWNAITTTSTGEDFIVLDTTNGAGDTTIGFTVLRNENIGVERTGSIIFPNLNPPLEYRIVQDPATEIICASEIIPASTVIDARANTQFKFRLIPEAEDCEWELNDPSADWVTPEDGTPTSGVGTRDFTFVAAANDTGAARTATISFGGDLGGATFTVTQLPAGNNFIYEFDVSPQGWVYETVPGFVEPTGVHDDTFMNPDGFGRLSITSADNTNSFGFWRSPQLPLRGIGGGDPADDDIDSEDLFRVVYRVSGDVPESADASIFRFRASTFDFQQANILVATSTGMGPSGGAFSPDAAGSREYIHYFTMPAAPFLRDNLQDFRMDFDLLNVDPMDVANQTLSLERVLFEPAEPPTEGTLVKRLDFTQAGDRAMFSPATLPMFASPNFGSNARGLTVISPFRGPGVPPTTVGFWSGMSDVVLMPGALYQVQFQVSAQSIDGLPVRKGQIPTFRLRVNDSTFASAALVNIESTSDDARLPTFSQPVLYDLWYEAPMGISSANMLLSFDYILTNPDGALPESNLYNDPTITLILESIEIREYTD